ncbi:MAG: hypothetical protein U9R25_17700 [Chloroflexota bacterium]|nr:hypothetical protein [Chloroflexota bacterium]
MTSRLSVTLLLLFAVGLLVYGLLAWPNLVKQTPNEFVALAEAFLDGHLDIIPELAPYLDLATFQERYYVPYPPAPALLYLPAVAAFGRGVHHAPLHLLLSATILPLFFLVLRRYETDTGYSIRENLWLVALLAFGSVLAPLAVKSNVYFTGQIVAVLFVCFFLLAAYRGRFPLLAGLFLGLGFLARGAVLLALPFALVEIWQGRADSGDDTEGVGKPLLKFGLALGIILILSAVYNWARFDHPLELGYRYLGWQNDSEVIAWGLFNSIYVERNLHAAFTSLPVLVPESPYILFNPEGLSLLITTPLLVMLPWLRAWTPAARTALLSSALIFLPALFYANTGFAQYGYRYAADFLPVLILGMALAGLRITSWRIKGLIVIGIVVSLYGALLAGWHPFSLEQFQLIHENTLLRYR